MKGFCRTLCFLLVCFSIVNAKENDVEGSGSPRRARRSPRTFVIKANELTEAEEQFAVDFHNLKRSKVQPPATNMLKMVYDQELAAIAKKYSRKCIYEHNYSPYTSTYVWPGEDLYVRTGMTQNMTYVLQRAVQHWFNEYKYYTYATMRCRRGKVCGHYTEMVWAENEAVGCGVTTCGNLFFNRRVRKATQLLVCYYGPGGNYYGERPYKTGVSCSSCPRNRECVCRPKSEMDLFKEIVLTEYERNDFIKYGFLLDNLNEIE